MEKKFRLYHVFDGTTYVRDERGWLDDRGPIRLGRLVAELERSLVERLEREDRDIDEPDLLLDRAWSAQAMSQPLRTERLCRRILEVVPHTPADRFRLGTIDPHWQEIVLPAAAMLCSSLRAQREPAKALSDTDPYADERYVPLRTSRAAALCDLNRWDEARPLADALMRESPDDEIHRLVSRIERHFEGVSADA